MRKFTLLALVALLALTISVSLRSATGPPSPLVIETEEQNPWTHLNMRNEPENFHFVIVSDRTGLPRQGIFAGAIQKIQHLQPAFVMSVGDFVEGYTLEGRVTDLEKIEKDWQYVTKVVEKLEMPFFYIVGNNDINSPEAAPMWRSRFGRTFYSFLYHEALFIAMSSEEPPGPGGIGSEQISWLKTLLKEHPTPRWTFLFMHRPMWEKEATQEEWAQVEDLLSDRPYTVFAGHVTRYRKIERKGRSYYTLSSTGSGDEPQLPPHPGFDHIV